jgi:glycosyltransferase involved in cell wall biosynthesis
MNILFVNKFYWDKGGSEAVYFGETELLKKYGHTVIPFSMHDEKNKPSEYAKYFVSNITYDNASLFEKIVASSRIIYSFEAKKKIRELLNDTKIDIAHFHIFQHQISPSIFGPLKQAGIPIVLTLHDLKPMCPNYQMYTHGLVCEQCKGHKYYHCFLNSCTKNSRVKSLVNTIEMYFHHFMGYYRNDVDSYIAVSQFFKNKMIEFGFNEDKIVYIPNFVDTEKFRYKQKDENYALFIGRLSSEKGIETLLEACKLTPDIPVIIAGTGPEEYILKESAKDKGLKNISFAGFKTGDDLLKLITDASFTILPSQWYENCPMSILESMAVGTPVIGASIGGINELIRENIDGFTFSPASADELAAKMLALWTDRELRITMGKQGAEKIRQQNTADTHYLKLLELYQSVLNQKLESVA